MGSRERSSDASTTMSPRLRHGVPKHANPRCVAGRNNRQERNRQGRANILSHLATKGWFGSALGDLVDLELRNSNWEVWEVLINLGGGPGNTKTKHPPLPGTRAGGT